MATINYAEPQVKSFLCNKTYGRSLHNQIIMHKPGKVIEFAPALGFTTCVISNALEQLGHGHLWTYDLFPDRFFRYRAYWRLRKNIWLHGTSSRVTVGWMDFDDWLKLPNDPYDLLYVDVHNHGGVLEKIKNLPGVVLFEGGSFERDMTCAYRGQRTMRETGIRYTVLDSNFPSLSRLG